MSSEACPPPLLFGPLSENVTFLDGRPRLDCMPSIQCQRWKRFGHRLLLLSFKNVEIQIQQSATFFPSLVAWIQNSGFDGSTKPSIMGKIWLQIDFFLKSRVFLCFFLRGQTVAPLHISGIWCHLLPVTSLPGCGIRTFFHFLVASPEAILSVRWVFRVEKPLWCQSARVG